MSRPALVRQRVAPGRRSANVDATRAASDGVRCPAMMHVTKIVDARAALVCALLALGGWSGCSSSGGAATDGGGTFDTGVASGGTLTWKENGTAHTALFAAAALARNSTLDVFQISGGDATGVGISFGIATRPPPVVTGSYNCGGAAYPIISFSYTGVDPQQPLTCTIDLTSVGLTTGSHAIGTFTASVPVSGGGTKTLTEGRFDIAENVASQ
jgi:hypothetical protein